MTQTPTPTKTYRCRFCKVEVLSRVDLRPVLGKEHGKHCRRRFKFK